MIFYLIYYYNFNILIQMGYSHSYFNTSPSCEIISVLKYNINQ